MTVCLLINMISKDNIDGIMYQPPYNVRGKKALIDLRSQEAQFSKVIVLHRHTVGLTSMILLNQL